MDLMHTNFGLGTGRLRALLGDVRILEKLQLYFARRRARRPKTLSLIERPGIPKSVLADRMLRIKTAKAPSLAAKLASQSRLRAIAVLWKFKPGKQAIADDGETISGTRSDNNAVVLFIAFETPGCSNATALSASIRLRDWIISGQGHPPTSGPVSAEKSSLSRR